MMETLIIPNIFVVLLHAHAQFFSSGIALTYVSKLHKSCSCVFFSGQNVRGFVCMRCSWVSYVVVGLQLSLCFFFSPEFFYVVQEWLLFLSFLDFRPTSVHFQFNNHIAIIIKHIHKYKSIILLRQWPFSSCFIKT